jgi:hypothetical protein
VDKLPGVPLQTVRLDTKLNEGAEGQRIFLVRIFLVIVEGHPAVPSRVATSLKKVNPRSSGVREV